MTLLTVRKNTFEGKYKSTNTISIISIYGRLFYKNLNFAKIASFKWFIHKYHEIYSEFKINLTGFVLCKILNWW